METVRNWTVSLVETIAIVAVAVAIVSVPVGIVAKSGDAQKLLDDRKAAAADRCG